MTAVENTWPWRTGRSVGRTIYACAGDDRIGDVLFGLMDSPEIAAHIVEAHNHWIGEHAAMKEVG